MAGDVHNRGVPWEIQQNGTLAPMDRLCNERTESPTTGLVEGTEPGAGQESAMFVHAQSFEDLTADSEVTTEMETERDSVLWESGQSVKEEALYLGRRRWAPKAGLRKRMCAVRSVVATGNVFVLSEAGKPIYSRCVTKEALSSSMVVLVSVVKADNSTICSIHADGYKVVFLRRTPLVLVGVSRTCQSDRELTRELQYIYYQIVSLLTLTQLNHIFQHKQNYELGRLLTGSEHLTDICWTVTRACSSALSLASPFPASPVTWSPPACRLPRPRTWSSPSSWLGTAWSRWYARRTSTCTTWTCTCSSTWRASSFREGEGRMPICHPKFNTAGFFHTHISYLEPAFDLCLILVSADREDFFNLSDCKHRFLERLSQCTAYKALEALKCPSYSVSQVGIPELRHFLYKSKTSGLYTSPELPLLYQSVEEQERLMGLYQYLHSRLHHPTRPLRSIYRCGETENLLAWVTSGIELYLCFSPLGTVAVAAVNKLLEWIKREDDSLFVLSPLTY
uniref:Vacuolar fusion protein MON1 homolog n=1 Tax=Salmo trutta TaxID=8032 RepID=A0A674CDF3_SALTR